MSEPEPRDPESGDDFDDSDVDKPDVALRIVGLHQYSRPAAESPFFTADGTGDWVMVECEAGNGARVVVGVNLGDGPGSDFVAVPDHAAGERLMQVFAAGFRFEPPDAVHRTPVQPLPLQVMKMGKQDRNGTAWYLNKVFVEQPEYAELYFNFSPAAEQAEFLSKDPAYREGLAKDLSLLRDGPRPERTPAIDLSLTDVGPVCTDFREVEFGMPVHAAAFRADGRVMAVTGRWPGPWVLHEVDANGLATRVASGENTFDRALFVGDDSVLVGEIARQHSGVSSTDPGAFWLFDRRTNQRQRLPVDEMEEARLTAPGPSLAEWPLPIGLVNFFNSFFRGESGEPTMLRIDATGATPLDVDGAVVGFDPPGSTRAILAEGEWDPDNATWTAVELTTGAVEKLDAPPTGLGTNDRGRTSPDGARRFDVPNARTITVTDGANGDTRVFHVHPYDTADAARIRWAGPYWLQFMNDRAGLIDVRTLLQNYPLPANEESQSLQFSPDFTRALRVSAGKLELGRVEHP